MSDFLKEFHEQEAASQAQALIFQRWSLALIEQMIRRQEDLLLAGDSLPDDVPAATPPIVVAPGEEPVVAPAVAAAGEGSADSADAAAPETAPDAGTSAAEARLS